MISFTILTVTLLLTSDEGHYKLTFHTRQYYESGLRSSASWGPTECLLKLDWDSFWFSVWVTIVSQFEKHFSCCMGTPKFGLKIQIPLPIYTCRGGIHINKLSCKISFWHFRECVSFEKTSLKFCCGKMLNVYNNWNLAVLNCFVHSLNLAENIDTTLTELSQKGSVS